MYEHSRFTDSNIENNKCRRSCYDENRVQRRFRFCIVLYDIEHEELEAETILKIIFLYFEAAGFTSSDDFNYFMFCKLIKVLLLPFFFDFVLKCMYNG